MVTGDGGVEPGGELPLPSGSRRVAAAETAAEVLEAGPAAHARDVTTSADAASADATAPSTRVAEEIPTAVEDVATTAAEDAAEATTAAEDAAKVTTAVEDAAVVSAFRLTSAGAVALEGQRPGVGLVVALDELAVADLDDATLVEAIAGWERVASWALASQARVVRELWDRRGSSTAAVQAVTAEVSARLGTTHSAAEVKVNLAAGLDLYPEVADALAAGRIDARKATVLIAREPGLSIAEQRRVILDLLPDATNLTGPQLHARLRAGALTTDPDAGAKRRAAALAQRHVSIEPAGDAMAWVAALVRADLAEATRVVLDSLAVAAKFETDTRTLDQRRADAFTDVFTTLLDRGVDPRGQDLPTFHGRRAQVHVTIGAGTLLGTDDEPAVLGGHGPIPADLARCLAQDGTWRALFTDAAGEFTALGTHAYRPGADLTRTVIARDVTCTFPGCRQPAWKSDLDHIDSYDPAVAAQLEQTTKIRLQALCRRHHNLKTQKIWDATRAPDGAITWTAPTGHTYTRKPDRPPGALSSTSGVVLSRTAGALAAGPSGSHQHVDDAPPPF
ncbi:HNH endonuclease signature motif containing protein [Georgenia sp. SYP-B2076]|uniref:HNH endonuclease signature motif containing protein n=1 Tax=Georgenia sp. SYP-B2076 TaxID=2495881 RepID=UPI000F8C3327|nr:HNH endonuclease signature motif containing protein [Georgenia sp. SYP-B2076]